jgi:hypothetical protein
MQNKYWGEWQVRNSLYLQDYASRKVDSKSLAMKYSDFCFCGQEKVVINLTPTKTVHDFSIILHGKLNNKDVKSEKSYFSIEVEGVRARIYPTKKGVFN